nr:LPXTG cell wall anchor domain-containing protein [Lachnospiraceae bacterium]
VTVEGAENATLSYKVTDKATQEVTEYTVLPTFTDAGEYNVEVTAAFGQFTLIDDADVVITPREVTIQSLSARKTFDGTPLVANDRVMLTAVTGEDTTVPFEATELLENAGVYNNDIFPGEDEGIEVVVTGSVIKGEAANTFEVKTANLKENYILKAVEGDLLVISRNREDEDLRIEIDVNGVTATYTYDGNAHAASGYTVPDITGFEVPETEVEYSYEYDVEKAHVLTDLKEVGEAEEESSEAEEENVLAKVFRFFAPMTVHAVDTTGYDNIPAGTVTFGITNTKGVTTVYAVSGVSAFVSAVNVGRYTQVVDASEAHVQIVEKDVAAEDWLDVTEEFSFKTSNGLLIINDVPPTSNNVTTTSTGSVLGADREPVTIVDEEVPTVLGADRPQTGDEANAFVWIFAMATASMIFGYAMLRRRKEEDEEA